MWSLLCVTLLAQGGDDPLARVRAEVRAWCTARVPTQSTGVVDRGELLAHRARALHSWPAGERGRALLADREVVRATFAGCFAYPAIEPTAEPQALPQAPGVRVYVPAAYDPARPVPTVVRIWPSDRELARGNAAVGPEVALSTSIVVFATPRQLEAMVRAVPRRDVFGALASGAVDMLGFAGASGLAARLGARELDDDLVQRGLFALLGVVLRRFNVDRDRLVLDCAAEACRVGLRAATSAPDRFAGVVLRAVPPLPTAALENLAGVPVLLLRGEDSFGSAVALKRQIDRATECEIWNATETRAAEVAFWCAERRRELMRPHVALVMRPDATVDGYWVSNISSASDGGAGDGPARIEVRADRELGAIRVACRRVDRFTLLLNDELIDLDRPFTLEVNGVAVMLRRTPSFSFLCETVFDRFDPSFLFAAEITVDVPRRG